jgi:hypothetical protein
MKDYRTVLQNDPGYQWLLNRLRRELELSKPEHDTMTTVRNYIISGLPLPRNISPNSPSQPCSVIYTVDWDPVAFLAEQEYGEPPSFAIFNAITLTGTCVAVQALTCLDYMNQVWPEIGHHTLGLIQTLVTSGHPNSTTCKWTS